MQAAAPKTPPAMVDEKYGSPAEIMALAPAKLVAILKDGQASVYAKAKACQRLAVVGDAGAVPALAALLGNEKLAVYARFALEPMARGAADDALREALPKLQGNLLIGAMNSLAKRRDPRSVDVLSKYVHDQDAAVARAAMEGLAKLRPAL
ncbi:MAG: hypothetical protein JNK48_29225 [Bryobacterales bacterium]|nr:hypothetical protein [Bryobacterales bacterium]